jgi:hypothetical protein
MILSPPDRFHPAISHQRIFHKDTTNIAVIEAFIQRYKGTSTRIWRGHAWRIFDSLSIGADKTLPSSPQ